MGKTTLERLRNGETFTRLYKENSGDKYLREARCVDFQVEHILQPLDENDVIAGRIDHDYIGFSSQYGGIYTYFFNEYPFQKALEECRGELDAEEAFALEAVAAFWKRENTAHKVDVEFISRYGYQPGESYFYPGFFNCACRVAGTNVDFGKLMELGLDGLERELDGWQEKNGNPSFYRALRLWLETLRGACERYRREALDMAERVQGGKRETFLQLAGALGNIRHRAPGSFLEGVQLMWIYSVCSDLMNYSRMDDYLGGLYQRDLESGVLTEEDGVQILLGLYKHFKEIDKVHDCRVIIGGVGRKDPQAADRLAMAVMEASRRFRETVPQLTLRYYRGMDEGVYRKALEVNAEGCTFPILYSDETNVPAVQKVYGVTREEAEQYVPFGCGEYVLAGLSTGTPNNGVNLLKALEITLHNGWDAYHHVKCGLETGGLSRFDTFEKLYQAYLEQLRVPVEQLAVHKYLNYQVAGREAPYLHLSLLMHDCLEKGLPLLEGGVRYLNASSEVFGIISCADSLTAIQKLVYEEKRFTLEELVRMLDRNFEGCEEQRRACLNAPKYGNDLEEADEMARRVFNDMADLTMAAGKKAGLNAYAIVSVNNSMSAEWGNYCEASACGRKRGEAMSNGNGASIGADKNGITALLNSMSKFDASKHVGVINNIRFTKELFTDSMDKVGVLLKAYLENGGVQANLCVVGKDDLENAMKHPENYQNLIVRIGGFSARFVTLSAVVQRELITRTTYGA